MMFVPVALACGHVIEGVGHYEVPAVGSTLPSRAECPEGCGWQEFVVEPHENSPTCLCQPGRHVCGEYDSVVIDLGYLQGAAASEDRTCVCALCGEPGAVETAADGQHVHEECEDEYDDLVYFREFDDGPSDRRDPA